MESINITPATGSYRKEIPANLLSAKVVSEKGVGRRNFSEKKCVHRTETGLCKRSNKQCPFFINL
jgi:hypothetical protein